MSSAKAFILVLLASVAAMAFMGASSASAITTQLCLNDEAPCHNPATHVHFTSTTAGKLLSSLGTVECEVLFLSTFIGSSRQPQIILGHFSYAGCSSPTLGTCEAKEVSSEAELEVSRSATEVEKGSVVGFAEVLVQCGTFIHCVYNGTGLEAEAEGSLLSGHTTISEQTVHSTGGFLCPTKGKLDLLLESLTALYLAEKESPPPLKTQLCETDEESCESPTTLVYLVSPTPAKLLSEIANVECSASFLSTEIGPLAQPQIILGHFTYTNCTSKLGSCEAKEVSKEAELKVEKTASEKAKVTGSAEVLVKCGSSLHCVYNGEGLSASAEGPLLADKTTISEQSLNKVRGFLCPSSAKLDLSLAPPSIHIDS